MEERLATLEIVTWELREICHDDESWNPKRVREILREFPALYTIQLGSGTLLRTALLNKDQAFAQELLMDGFHVTETGSEHSTLTYIPYTQTSLRDPPPSYMATLEMLLDRGASPISSLFSGQCGLGSAILKGDRIAVRAFAKWSVSHPDSLVVTQCLAKSYTMWDYMDPDYIAGAVPMIMFLFGELYMRTSVTPMSLKEFVYKRHEPKYKDICRYLRTSVVIHEMIRGCHLGCVKVPVDVLSRVQRILMPRAPPQIL